MSLNRLAHTVIRDYKSFPYDWGYIFGTLASDGSIYYNPSKGGIIELTVKDYDYAKMFADCLNRVTGLSIQPAHDNIRPMWRTRLNHVMLTRQLLSIQSWKTHDWRVPSSLIYDDFDTARGFLNAFFDGEGNVARNNNGNPMLRLSSSNKDGLNDIAELMSTMDIETSFHYVTDNPVSFSYGTDMWVLGIYSSDNMSTYVDKIGITMPRKLAAYHEILESKPPPSDVYWTGDDIAKLMQLYPTTSIDKLVDIFPGRSWQSINHKVSRLGISRRYMAPYVNSNVE